MLYFVKMISAQIFFLRFRILMCDFPLTDILKGIHEDLELGIHLENFDGNLMGHNETRLFSGSRNETKSDNGIRSAASIAQLPRSSSAPDCKRIFFCCFYLL